MLFTSVVLLSALLIYIFSIRRQLRFFLCVTEETEGLISKMEPFYVRSEESSHWETQCTVDYRVAGKEYNLKILRRELPVLGESVLLTYPKIRPDEAVEGDTYTAGKKHMFAIIASFIFVAIIVSIPLHM